MAQTEAVRQIRPFSAADAWICLALAMATLALYSGVRRLDFVSYDDYSYLVQNVHFKGKITGETWRWACFSGDEGYWFPLTRLSYLLDFRLFGMQSAAFHLTNLLFHVAATLMLYVFLFRATGDRGPAAWVAFLFALHPLHVESVAWVAERKDVICALFWFAALWAWVRYAERPCGPRYLVTLLFFGLGLMAKPMIVTLPFLLLLLNVWPLRRPIAARRLFLEQIPFVALSLVFSTVTYVTQHTGGGIQSGPDFPVALRVGNALLTWAVFILKTIWPTGLAAMYPYPERLSPLAVTGAALLLLAVSLLTLRAYKSHPYLPVGWFWFLGSLVPVIGLIQAGKQARTDHFMYVPGVGLFIVIAWGAAELVNRLPAARTVAPLLAITVCCALSIVSWFQIQYWKNSESLYRRAIAVTNGNFRAWLNLSDVLMDQPGREAQGLAALESALRIKPSYANAHVNLGVALIKINGHAALGTAIQEFKAAIRLDPENAGAHFSLASALVRLGQFEEAVQEAETAVRLQPKFAAARDLLGTALSGVPGRLPEAIEQLTLAIGMDPSASQTHNDLGVALARTGRRFDALLEFQAAVAMNPDFQEARVNEAKILIQLPGRAGEAGEQLKAALASGPDAEASAILRIIQSPTGSVAPLP